MTRATDTFVFSSISYGERETPWSLTQLLYRGGAGRSIRESSQLMQRGKLGPRVQKRIPMVRALHEAIDADLASGRSRFTASQRILALRKFYGWADDQDLDVTHGSAPEQYLAWTASLYANSRLRSVSYRRYLAQLASIVGHLLDEVLRLEAGLYSQCALKGSVRRGVPQSHKENLSATFAFGQLLFAICSTLTAETIRGPLPITIAVGSSNKLEEWSGLRRPELLKAFAEPRPRHYEKSLQRRRAWEEDNSSRTRRPLLNLRIASELLMFIAQTGINLAQTSALHTADFSFQSYSGGYRVRRKYKHRRQGEVEFEIYKEYREHFEKYLEWHRDMLGEDERRLFPLDSSRGAPSTKPPTFASLRHRCLRIGVPFVGPQQLRRTRINWLHRYSGDTALTAEVAQHTTRTLRSSYVLPSHQRALVEIGEFHRRTEALISPPGPGGCVVPAPVPIDTFDGAVPKPDCISPAGCLFCRHHRDIRTQDYVWSLATYRHLKIIELSGSIAVDRESSHPCNAVVNVVAKKLARFSEMSPEMSRWVREADARVEEGDYHPKWDGFIRLMEHRA